MMANPSGRKGASWEKEVANYLKDHGFPLTERRVKNGRYDRGDISGVRNTVIECKAERAIDLPGYLGELEVEQSNDEARFGFVFVKNRRHGVGDGYAVLSIAKARELLVLLRDAGLL
jgi:Holliday junction resolvase-like predicted endonuclease